MARPGRLRFAPKMRERMEANNEAQRKMAIAFGKPVPPEFLNEIAPVRKYVRHVGAATESAVLTEIRRAAHDCGVTLWRNSRGTVQLPSGGMLRYGVGPNGASDFIGFKSVTITPAMVGMQVAVLVAIEAKAPGKRPTPEQEGFLMDMQHAGAITGVATSADEARAILAGRE